MVAVVDVSGLTDQITATLVPTACAVVMSIVNFINHHTHSQKTEALMKRVSDAEAKVMTVDNQIQAQKANIAVGVDALGGIIPGLNTTLSGHSKQIQEISTQISNLTAQLQKLQSSIPVESKPPTT